METAAKAIRYALRQFWTSRVFTAAAVLTLAIAALIPAARAASISPMSALRAE